MNTINGESGTRYIVRGLIDGSLSALGVVIGASGSADASVIIAAGLGGGIANGLSNILGAFTAEKASLERERIQKEKSLLKKNGYLKKSIIYKKAIRETMICGLIDGISTTIGSALPVVPFFLFDIKTALYVAIGITIAILFILGVFIGKISKENVIISGIKMVAGALAVAILCFMIEKAF
ncbi:TPA: TIGR00267 family protein [Methanocaldococcus jannaschii]|uniref:TIGR00267 family protein n=1 Tax=Methanocaldococcus jannaschii TaxID=2190 RepID=A0A832WIQ7_9EURY|nr:TIGR00267 family protein [Methanocaldococcus jannaschii]